MRIGASCAPRWRRVVFGGVVLAAGTAPAQVPSPNYAEALQHALYFYEAQTSGALPLEARVEWRGDSALRDGSDVERDLTGGWYDAGDGVVWTAHDAFAATMLAWSLADYADVYRRCDQYERAMDRLREIGLYLQKVVEPASPTGFRIYVGKGTTRHAPPDDPALQNDRTAALPHEVMDTPVAGAPQMIRPSYWVDDATGGADVAGQVAAAGAAVAVVLRRAGDPAAAAEYLALARRLAEWGDTHRNAATVTRRLTDGRVVDLANYATRSANSLPALLLAAAWLHRAEIEAGTAGYAGSWVERAAAWYAESGNASNRGRPWVGFGAGAPHAGACALLAAATGREPFVGEANAYADFWLYRRRNDTGLASDILTTPAGFVCRGNGAAWNIPALLDQAPPLLAWADSPHQSSARRRADTLALFTGVYAGAPVRQLDYILGFNPLGMSYLQGFAPPGKTWVRNLHYRASLALYGGFGTPGGMPTANAYPCYGLLAPGPDHTDFYPVTAPAIDGQIAYKEPIVYSGGLLTALARMIREQGAGAGQVTTVFPAWVQRAKAAGVTGFFVAAYREEGRVANGVRLQLALNNRASLPAREINSLGFRYYFTPDGVDGSTIVAQVTGLGLLAGESVRVVGPRQDAAAGGAWYVEVRLEQAYIVPGEFSRYRRRVQLDLSQRSGIFSADNDFSGAAISTAANEAVIAALPVYDVAPPQPVLLGGVEPSAGYVQWRRSHFNNTLERAGGIELIAERVGGSAGAVSTVVTTESGTAVAGVDFVAPPAETARVRWADGESGEKVVRITVPDDEWDEGREHFYATLGDFSGGVRAGAVVTARVSIEDDDAGRASAPHPPSTGPSGVRLVNASVRGQFRNGEEMLIPGLAVADGALHVLVRAVGPGLASFGVPSPAPDPHLQVLAPNGVVLAANDHWGASAGAAHLPELFRKLGAFGLSAGSRDAALSVRLNPGTVTVPVQPGNRGGEGLVEVYEAMRGPGRLRNLSVRGRVGGDDGPMLVGFALAGAGTKRLLVRAAGPALQQFGVAGALRDPVLAVVRVGSSPSSGEEIVRNDAWPATLAAEFARVGAFAFASGSGDAAAVLVLSAGDYTAVISSAAGGSGIALVELYDADP